MGDGTDRVPRLTTLSVRVIAARPVRVVTRRRHSRKLSRASPSRTTPVTTSSSSPSTAARSVRRSDAGVVEKAPCWPCPSDATPTFCRPHVVTSPPPKQPIHGARPGQG